MQSSSDLTSGAANASAACGIALGQNALASGARAIAIGELACGNAANTVNIGWQARGVGSESIAIGYNARGNGSGAIVAIGYDAYAQGNYSIAIGAATNAIAGNRGIAIGNTISVVGDYFSAIGYGHNVSGDRNVIIGSDTTPSNCVTNNILIGCNIEVVHTTCATAVPSGNIAIGNGATICTTGGGPGDDGDNIAIGTGAVTYGSNGTKSVAIGYQARTGRFNSVAIGPNTCTADGANIAVAIGSGSNASGELAIAIGYLVTASPYSIAMGWSPASSQYAVSLGGWGGGGASSSQDGITIGRNTCVSSAACGIAFGYNACVTHTGAVAIGAGVASEKAATTHVNHLIAYGQGASKVNAIGSTGGTITIDWDDANNQTLSLTSSITSLTLSNPIAGASYSLAITQAGTGSYTITWPASVKWPAGFTPILSTGVGEIDVISLIYDGTNYYGSAALNFS
jgi:hypothetical protein